MQVSKKLVAIQRVVDALEAHGFQIRIVHLRRSFGTSKGGYTGFEITHPLGWKIRESACCSNEDNFDKATGTRVAFQRAIRALSKKLGRRELKAILNP